jgi:DNA recombination protein RmuC
VVSTLYVGAAVFALVILYVAIARLLKRQSVAPRELQAVQSERDRFARELQEERETSRNHAAEASRAAGRLGAIESERQNLEGKVRQLEGEMRELRDRLERQIGEVNRSATTLGARDESIERLQSELRQKVGEVEQFQSELSASQAELTRTTANLVHSQRAQEEMKNFLNEAQEKLSGVFAQLAGSVFDQKAQVFEKNVEAATLRSKADIDSLLKPFADRLGEFRQRVDQVYGDEAKERRSLLGAVTELKTLNQEMATQASALTRALKGSAKVRGDWGELMLESVLRGSGLEEGVHYDRQKSTVDDEGQRLKPDIVVRLPDDRRIVVDSKVNLIAWQEAMNAEFPESQQDALRRHAIALRQHVKDLAEKNYPKAVGASALDVTIAFVPIEGALSAALGYDTSLQTNAFEKGVVFASPNTLMAILRVVERLWTRDRIQRQAQDISDAGSKLLDALIRFMADFDSVGKKLTDAGEAFADARRALSESPQAAIPRARRLVELGSKGRRSLPPELLQDELDLEDNSESDLPAASAS